MTNLPRLVVYRLLFVLLSWVSVSCANGGLVTDEVTFGTSVLEEKLGKKFPLDKRLLELMDVTTGKPKLRMLPETNRVALDFDATFGGPGAAMIAGKNISGKLSLNSGLRYDSPSRSIVLVAPTVDQVSIEDVAGVSPYLGGKLKTLLGIMVEETLNGAPVHTFSEDELTRFGNKIEPGDISVRSYGIKVDIKKRDDK